MAHQKTIKEAFQIRRIDTGETADVNKKIGESQLDKTIRNPEKNSSESSQDSGMADSRRRSKRFEDALLKWQEYGNDIIERKPPNFLQLKNKTRKGTWIYAGGKSNDKKDEVDSGGRELVNEKKDVYQRHVEELSGRLTNSLREFEEMHKRSAKIELTLKQLKEKAMTNLQEGQDCI